MNLDTHYIYKIVAAETGLNQISIIKPMIQSKDVQETLLETLFYDNNVNKNKGKLFFKLCKLHTRSILKCLKRFPLILTVKHRISMVLALAYDPKCLLHTIVLKTDDTVVQMLKLISLEIFTWQFISSDRGLYPGSIKSITIHHECPCWIGKSHPSGWNFYQGRGLPSPWLKFQPRG